MNVMRTGILLAGLVALFMAVGYAIGGQSGMLIALVLSVGMNAFAYWNSDKMVLSMHGARQIDRAASPEFYDMIAKRIAADLGATAEPAPAGPWSGGARQSNKGPWG